MDSDGHRWATEDVADMDCSGLITATVDVLACGGGMSWCESSGGCHGTENPGCIYAEIAGAAALDPGPPLGDAQLLAHMMDCFDEALVGHGCAL